MTWEVLGSLTRPPWGVSMATLRQWASRPVTLWDQQYWGSLGLVETAVCERSGDRLVETLPEQLWALRLSAFMQASAWGSRSQAAGRRQGVRTWTVSQGHLPRLCSLKGPACHLVAVTLQSDRQ